MFARQIGNEGRIDIFGYAFDRVQTGLVLMTDRGVVERINTAGAAIVGRDPEGMVGVPFPDLVHPDDVEATREGLAQLLTTGQAGPMHVRVIRPDGGMVWVRAHGTLVVGDQPVVFAVFEDVSLEHEVQDALRAAEEASTLRSAQQAAVAQMGRSALAGADAFELAQQATELLCQLLHVRFVSVLFDDGNPEGRLQVASSGDVPEVITSLRRPSDDAWVRLLRRREPLVLNDIPAAGMTSVVVDRALLTASGLGSIVASPIVPNQAPPGALVAGDDARDVFTPQTTAFLESMANILASAMDARRAMDELRHHTLHDSLTGLANRTLVLDHLEQALNQAPRAGHRVAVLLCDLDHFKDVNDTFGHAAGDAVLQTVATRLSEHVRPGDTVGRFGGDEFVVVCPQVERPAVLAIAERLTAAFRHPILVRGTEIVVTASIGITFGAHDATGAAETLLREADIAMYRAKAKSRGRFELFDATTDDRPSSRRP